MPGCNVTQVIKADWARQWREFYSTGEQLSPDSQFSHWHNWSREEKDKSQERNQIHDGGKKGLQEEEEEEEKEGVTTLWVKHLSSQWKKEELEQEW